MPGVILKEQMSISDLCASIAADPSLSSFNKLIHDEAAALMDQHPDFLIELGKHDLLENIPLVEIHCANGLLTTITAHMITNPHERAAVSKES